MLPKVSDYEAFNYQPNNIRTSLIARAISDQQNIIWGTGGHTSTSVHVYSYGKDGSTTPFSGRLSHPKIGRLLINALKN
jgi:alkaline phosphatase